MDIQAEKIELAKQILETEDEALLSEIKAILASHVNVLNEDLPEYVKEAIQKSREQVAQGLVVPHKEVMEKYARFQRSK